MFLLPLMMEEFETERFLLCRVLRRNLGMKPMVLWWFGMVEMLRECERFVGFFRFLLWLMGMG